MRTVPLELGETRASSTRSIFFPIHSPAEEQGVSGSKSCVREATVSGFRNASIAGAVASGPVIIGCRVIPWAKSNLKHTAQALLISSASIAAFFITADKTILERAKQNSRTKLDKTS